MKHIGEHLKRIRLDWGKSLRGVSQTMGVSHQLLDKVERGKVIPSDSLLIKYSNGFKIPLDTLRIIKYTDEVVRGSEWIQKKKDILKVLRVRLENPTDWVHIPNSNPLKRERVRKPYIRGGVNGKVRGFGFYFQPNEKLKKKDRRELLRRSENYMGGINGGELDSNLTDLEIVEEWNRFFDEYGFRFPEFKGEWLKYHTPNGKGEGVYEPSEPIKLPSFLNNRTLKVEGFG